MEKVGKGWFSTLIEPEKSKRLKMSDFCDFPDVETFVEDRTLQTLFNKASSSPPL